MIKQIKKYGSSKIIILDKDTLNYLGLTAGDYVDISDIVKVEKNKFMGEDD